MNMWIFIIIPCCFQQNQRSRMVRQGSDVPRLPRRSPDEDVEDVDHPADRVQFSVRISRIRCESFREDGPACAGLLPQHHLLRCRAGDHSGGLHPTWEERRRHSNWWRNGPWKYRWFFLGSDSVNVAQKIWVYTIHFIYYINRLTITKVNTTYLGRLTNRA